MESIDALAAHRRAQEEFGRVLAGVPADQLDAPTPCSEWTVREVIMHVVSGNSRVAGESHPDPTDLAGFTEAHSRSAAAAESFFQDPEVAERIFEMPFGRIPGSVLLRVRTADVFTHGWDLAAATGQPTDLAPQLAGELLAFSKQLIRPELRGPGRAFAAEQVCGDDATPADRLAAFLGRKLL